MASPPIKKTEPISILKAPPPLSPLNYANTSAMVRNEPIILSDDEDEDPRNMISDEDEDPALIPSEKTLELLQTEKVCHSGYLLKKGEKRRTWKKRWFVLRTTKLAMYKDKKEYKLLRIIDLHDILSVIQVTSKNKYRYVFAIYTPKRTYYVQAEDQLTMKDWLEAIEQAKGELKLYDANDNPNVVGQQLQEQDISRDIVHSYKSTASNLSNSTSNNATTSYSQQRRPSGSSSSSGILADTRRPSNGLMHASSSPSTAFSSNNNNIQPTSSSNNMKSDKTSKNLRINVSPIDLPKPQVTFSSTPIHDDSANPIYPVSPTFDQYQAHTNEGIASSDDDEEYSAANSIIDIKKEEDRNRVLVEGYLLKLGRNKGWQKRWFVLRTDTLAYYENDKEYSPHRIIPLSHIKNSLQIEPMSKNKQYCFKISIPKRQYVLCASTENDMKSWLNALNIAVKQLNNNETSTNLSSSSSPQAQTSISPSDKSTKPNHHHSRFPHLPHPHLPHLHHQQQQQQQQQQALRLEQIPEMERSTSQMARKLSLDSFENVSHISGVSGAGAVGGAGGALGRR